MPRPVKTGFPCAIPSSYSRFQRPSMLTFSPRLVAVWVVPWVWASWSDPSPSGAALRVKNGFEFVFLGVGFVSFHVRLHCEAELLVYKILYISSWNGEPKGE